jgi:hypothetical protein
MRSAGSSTLLQRTGDMFKIFLQDRTERKVAVWIFESSASTEKGGSRSPLGEHQAEKTISETVGLYNVLCNNLHMEDTKDNIVLSMACKDLCKPQEVSS